MILVGSRGRFFGVQCHGFDSLGFEENARGYSPFNEDDAIVADVPFSDHRTETTGL